MVPSWGLLADFLVVFRPPLWPNATNLTWQKSLFADGLRRSRSGYAQLLETRWGQLNSLNFRSACFAQYKAVYKACVACFLGCFIFSTFLKLNTFVLMCDGILDTDFRVKMFAIMTSFRGGTAVLKSAGDRNSKICHISAMEGDGETKLVSKCAEGSTSYTLLIDFMAVF